jgi:hypothetical protein
MPTLKQYPDAAARQRAYRQRQVHARNQEQKAKGMPAAPAVSTLPSQPRWHALHAQAHAALTTIQTEMQCYYHARSESLQDSERGEGFAERMEAYEALITELDNLQ